MNNKSFNKIACSWPFKMNKIGEGAYGKVYKACTDKDCKKFYAVKNSQESLRSEFQMAKKLENMNVVPKAFFYKKCAGSGRNRMFSNYIESLDLEKFIKNNNTNEKALRIVIFIVLNALFNISQRYPSFRHNDLHLGNVLVTLTPQLKMFEFKIDNKKYSFKTKILPYITDLGLSTVNGINNEVMKDDPEFFANYGIATDNHPMYDTHFFLSSIYEEIKNRKNFKDTKKFIESLFDRSYLKMESNKVTSGRMIYKQDHKGLPTLKDILVNEYFNVLKEKTNKVSDMTNKIVKQVPMLVTPKPKTKAKTPVNMNAAKKKAAEVLMKDAQKPKKKPVAKKPVIVNEFNYLVASPEIDKKTQLKIDKRMMTRKLNDKGIRENLEKIYGAASPGHINEIKMKMLNVKKNKIGVPLKGPVDRLKKLRLRMLKRRLTDKQIEENLIKFHGKASKSDIELIKSEMMKLKLDKQGVPFKGPVDKLKKKHSS